MIREAIWLAAPPQASPPPAAVRPAPAHVPVLLQECLAALRAPEGGRFVDCTLGLGGHTRALLEANSATRVLAFDRDARLLERARERLAGFEGRVIFQRRDFRTIAEGLREAGWDAADGILADLGISRVHYELGAGFSFREASPLDMRLEPDGDGPTAAQLLNQSSEAELADIFFHFGEIRAARKLARLIAERRAEQPFDRADEFAAFVAAHLPPSRTRHGIHPATEAFQALRIAVNRELDGLAEFCALALGGLRPGGRLAVIAFHSLEDRAIKTGCRALTKGCICPPRLPRCACGRVPLARTVGPQPVKPTDAECAANPPSRSARLRVIEKLEPADVA
jgi:16S rRNA (cytosine1402-N4)-methyltransferase